MHKLDELLHKLNATDVLFRFFCLLLQLRNNIGIAHDY